MLYKEWREEKINSANHHNNDMSFPAPRLSFPQPFPNPSQRLPPPPHPPNPSPMIAPNAPVPPKTDCRHTCRIYGALTCFTCLFVNHDLHQTNKTHRQWREILLTPWKLNIKRDRKGQKRNMKNIFFKMLKKWEIMNRRKRTLNIEYVKKNGSWKG